MAVNPEEFEAVVNSQELRHRHMCSIPVVAIVIRNSSHVIGRSRYNLRKQSRDIRTLSEVLVEQLIGTVSIVNTYFEWWVLCNMGQKLPVIFEVSESIVTAQTNGHNRSTPSL